jgi:hypothetical protein
LLSAVIVGLVQRQRAGTAFIIFSGLLVFAMLLTLYAYCENKHHLTHQEASEAGVLDDRAWISRELFLKSVPGVWLLVLGSGLGFGIAAQDRLDL